jgi:L-histidine N-alpha-methyltransferase
MRRAGTQRKGTGGVAVSDETTAVERIRIEDRSAPHRERDLQELRETLQRTPREVPSKHLYDERGSWLFERICELPEYYQTRTEKALLERHADRIAAISGATELVEIGAGAATKTRVLLRAMERARTRQRSSAPPGVRDGREAGGQRPPAISGLERYVPIDVDVTMLERVAGELTREFPELFVHGIGADFDHSLDRLPPNDGKRLIAFLGSTIGNLRPTDQAPALVSAIRRQMKAGDHFLLGVDLIKDRARLEAAYNDTRGVTAAFSRNIWYVVNRLADADFDPEAFRHLAFWDEKNAWMDIRQVSARAQHVRLRAIDLELDLHAGEQIRTEISAKYDRERIAALLHTGGLELAEWITDDDNLFGLALARGPLRQERDETTD